MRCLILVALLGCGRVGFDLAGTASDGDGGTAVDDDGGMMTGGDDGGVIGGSDAAVSQSTCTQPAVGCTFPGGLPCTCWGSPMMVNAGMSESSGSLLITPNANTVGAQGSCTRAGVAFGPEGVLVEVSQVVSGAQGLTALSLGASPDIYEMSVRSGMIQMTDGSNSSSTSYDANAMRWWRIRPNPAGGVMFETSPDGEAWSLQYGVGRAPSASYSVRIIGGTIGAQAAPGSARFEGINVCPP